MTRHTAPKRRIEVSRVDYLVKFVTTVFGSGSGVLQAAAAFRTEPYTTS
jgi:hypothetical protein